MYVRYTNYIYVYIVCMRKNGERLFSLTNERLFTKLREARSLSTAWIIFTKTIYIDTMLIGKKNYLVPSSRVLSYGRMMCLQSRMRGRGHHTNAVYARCARQQAGMRAVEGAVMLPHRGHP